MILVGTPFIEKLIFAVFCRISEKLPHDVVKRFTPELMVKLWTCRLFSFESNKSIFSKHSIRKRIVEIESNKVYQRKLVEGAPKGEGGEQNAERMVWKRSEFKPSCWRVCCIDLYSKAALQSRLTSLVKSQVFEMLKDAQ